MRATAAGRGLCAGLAALATGLVSAPAQTPPAPRLFAPGVVSTGDIEFAPALTPDGRTLYLPREAPA